MARVKTKSGQPLTKERVEELAREAEQGYDLSKAKRERIPRGRPSLDKGVSPRISYRVAHRLYSQAKKRAKAEGRTVSEIAREALERYVS
jgi:hypothetical protein